MGETPIKNLYVRGMWDMFDAITGNYYGKQCYFLRDEPATMVTDKWKIAFAKPLRVYSRISGSTLTFEEAFTEFCNYMGQ